MLAKFSKFASKSLYKAPSKSFVVKPPRLPFSQLASEDLSYFNTFLQPHEVITDSSELEIHNQDWKKTLKGNSSLLLKPNTTEKVSKILKYCHDKNLAVVPQGGNTGLVGGSVPIFDEVILSLANMKKVHGFNKYNAVLTCEAGCVLEDLNNHLNKDGYEVPLDLGAKGSCQIGGNISTHAGGIHFIKYGPLKGNILGLEVVLADGRIMNLESEIRKDNTGLDMKQLFIGSEGLLGIITKANIQCVKKDEYSRTLMLRVNTYEEVLKISELTRRVAGKNLSALEFFDDYSYWSICKYIPGIVPPFKVADDFSNLYVLVELSGSQSLDELEKIYFDALVEEKLANDCIISESESQARNMWKIREDIATASNAMGPFLIYDFSVDIKDWMELSHIIREKTKHIAFTKAYGHIGDGNIHVDIVYKEEKHKQELLDILEPSTFKWLSQRQGSISAEHGVGFFKANYFPIAKEESVIKMIKDIKQVFDPKGILNPYKVLPNNAMNAPL